MAVRAVRAGTRYRRRRFVHRRYYLRERDRPIVEVNASTVLSHARRALIEGEPRDVPARSSTYSHAVFSRIPVAAITGTNGKTTTTRMLARIMKSRGTSVFRT